ncbi:MAG: DUF4270 domain-containing protein [Rikenellaceae bacterium]|jgi:hypothetical protein|nr:DUF4270 domain-containing protein [Rikenellaceae bacterium]
MKSYKVALPVLAAFSAFSSCTKVDDSLGLDLVPDNQRSVILIDTLSTGLLETSQRLADSVVSSKQGIILFGEHYDALSGRTATAGIVQFLPFVKETYFGTGATVDSLLFDLTLARLVGDTAVNPARQFDVYAVLPEKLSYDSTYYVNFDPSTILGPKLFSFEHSGPSAYKTIVLSPAKNTVTADGWAFMNRLRDASKEINDSEDKFHKEFGGFYIVQDAASLAPGTTGAIYEMNIGVDSYYTVYSSMTIYAHNYEGGQVKDTLAVSYHFIDGSTAYRNTSLTTVRHDYTNTPVEQSLTDTENNGFAYHVYEHSPAGAKPVLTFTDTLIGKNATTGELTGRIASMMTRDGVSYSALAVNRAQLIIPLKERSLETLNNSAYRLGMYYKYETFAPIPDWAYSYESYYGEGSIPYGGYLARGLGYYSMDITSYVQQLISYPDKVGRNITIGSTPSAALLTAPFTQIDGAGIQLILTYTLIR